MTLTKTTHSRATETSSGRATFHDEEGLHVGTVIKHGPKDFAWLTRYHSGWVGSESTAVATLREHIEMENA